MPRPKGTCIYCGAFGPLHMDHIPQGNLFQPGQKSNLVTVPCCRRCNTTASKETGKNRGLSQLRIGCLLRPWLPRRSVARHSSFKTSSRLGVGDRLRGSHLDQDQVSLSSQPPVFPGLRARVLAQQRYAKSHRILANCRGVKDFRRFRNSQDGTWFSRSVLGA